MAPGFYSAMQTCSPRISLLKTKRRDVVSVNRER